MPQVRRTRPDHRDLHASPLPATRAHTATDPGKATAMSLSMLERIASWPPEEREAYYAELPEEEAALVAYGDWSMAGRPEQFAPAGEWRTWVLMGGRRGGKSRSASEWIVDRHQKGSRKALLVARRAKDVRGVIVKGPSGVLAAARRRGIEATWTASRSLILLKSEAGETECTTILGGEPEDAAGLESDTAWLDEWCSYMVKTDDAGRTTLDNVDLGLSALGEITPQMVLTSTPRPTGAVRGVIGKPRTVMSRVTMFDNERNLDPVYVQAMIDRYAGTRLERQELYGELLDAEGAYFTRTDIPILDEQPDLPMWVRYWDLAHARASAANPDPDWTVGVKVGTDGNRLVVGDVRRVRGNHIDVEQLIVSTASSDGPGVRQVVEKTPGAGKAVFDALERACHAAGIRIEADAVTAKKVERAGLPSDRSKQGRLQVVRAAWLDVFLDECEAFPDGPHDDQVDGLSGAVHWLDKMRGKAPRAQSRKVTDTKIQSKVPWAL